MSQLPTISIIVPNFNGGATIETTLLSLINQQYPKLEILVVDGGSTDNSLDVIKRYETHIAWWVSEKDRGQSHAINKGFAQCTGEIVNWLCSDDILLPRALHTVGTIFADEPATDVVAGTAIEHYTDGHLPDRIWVPSDELIRILPVTNPFGQPSCFYRRWLIEARKPTLDESYHYEMDQELWTFFKSQGARWKTIRTPMSIMFYSGTNKSCTGREKYVKEFEDIYKRYVQERIPLTYWHRRLRYPVERIRNRNRGLLFAMFYFPYQCAIIALLSPFYGFKRVRWMNWAQWG